ncbi:MAG: hypothetical protein K1Y02_18490 [Candidatus Hydrogenedentes bacterium]|nr:hypothetical protein [Candidatus Hydrogenedentota bacterium]
METILNRSITPDWRSFLKCLRREGTPKRVHHIELFLDPEVQEAVCERFELIPDVSPDDPFFAQKRHLAVQQFLGYDFVRASLDDMVMPLRYDIADDTADLKREGGRNYVNESTGPIANWEDFERYPWPDPAKAPTKSLDWYSEHLPENMCIVGSGGFAHFAEYLNWLLGYEALCVALFEQRDLLAAISKRLLEMYEVVIDRVLAYDRVKVIWGSDDMGFRTGPLISPDDLREFVLPGHKRMAEKSHAAGRPYLLHCCGKIDLIIDDLIHDVGIDAKHSFEDTIELVTDAKRAYGDRIALLGGIDVDFLCRADEGAIRKRVRETLDVCLPGGGYCLGTGNSVANYIPLDSYLVMLDEGRRYMA